MRGLPKNRPPISNNVVISDNARDSGSDSDSDSDSGDDDDDEEEEDGDWWGGGDDNDLRSSHWADHSAMKQQCRVGLVS